MTGSKKLLPVFLFHLKMDTNNNSAKKTSLDNTISNKPNKA